MQRNKAVTGVCIGEHEVSRIADLSVRTLRKWRSQGKGPRFLKLGGAVRYRVNDVHAWLAANAK